MKNARQKRLIASRTRLLQRLLVRQEQTEATLTRINRRIADLDAWLEGLCPGRRARSKT